MPAHSLLFSKSTKGAARLNVPFPQSKSPCFASTLTLREEKRLQVFENKVLRKIFGPKKDDQTGEWRRIKYYGQNNLFIVSAWNILKFTY